MASDTFPSRPAFGFVHVRPPVLSFDPTSIEVSETGEVTLTVVRVGQGSFACAVDYATVEGTALASINYSEDSGTLTWTEGDVSPQTFPITILSVEDGLEFTVVLSNPQGALLGEDVCTVTLAEGSVIEVGGDNQSPPDFPAFSYYESDVSFSVGFSFLRSGGSGACTGSWSIRANDGVTITSDTSGDLEWADGDFDPKTITVTGAGAVVTPFNPSFYVDLVAVSGCTVGGEAANAPLSSPPEEIPVGTAYGALFGF